MNNVNKVKRKNDSILLEKYKEYFKSFIKFKKNCYLHKTHLNSMYLQFRDKYQNFLIKQKNSLGLKFKGNKIYENLPLNIFQDNYILNTFNISKELENNVLQYFLPYDTKELSPEKEKEIEGEKIKLTPIPFKNGLLINTTEEKNIIQEAKRSAVLMRRVEYTHLIKKSKTYKKENNEKNDEDKNKVVLNLNEKIYILKGAIIIIEEWWKKMKAKKRETKSKVKKRKNKINLNYESEINRNKNDFHFNIYSNGNKSTNKINRNNTYMRFKSNNKNENKKPNKLNMENDYTINPNKLKKNKSNKINLKLSNNKNNNSASMNRKILKSIQNLKNNKNNNIPEVIIKINENEIDENKIILEQLKNKKAKLKSPKRKKENTKNKSINNKTNNKANNKNPFDTTKSINNDVINKLTEKIYNDINEKNNMCKKHLNTKKKNTNNNKSKLFKNNKNISQKVEKKPLNNLKIQNHLKNRNSNELVYEHKDIIKINDLNNNTNNSLASKHNKNKNVKKKENLELNIKTNYDIDRKNTILNERRIESAKSSDTKRINNLDKIDSGNRFNTENNKEINLLDKKEENNYKRIKYVESKENEFQILSFKKNQNDIIKKLNINLNDINNNNIKEFLEDNTNKTENINNININDKTSKNKTNNFNEENKINEDNNLIKAIIKRNKTYSFKKIKKEKNNITNDDSKKSKDDSKIFNESKNKIKRLYDIYKSEDFYIYNDIKKEKQFINLKVEENNNNLTIFNSKSESKKNKLEEQKELTIENKFLIIKNENQSFKKNIPLSINKLEIEFKGDNDNIINTQNEDSEIIPIEKDSKIPVIYNKFPKDNTINNNHISSNFNFYIKNTYSSNDENILNSINNINSNNKLDSQEDLSNDSIDKININLPKSGKYNLLEKIIDLFPQNINENIEKNQNDEKIKLKTFNKNNNIKIKNLKINKSYLYFFDSNLNNNIHRSKSENKGKKINCIKTNLTTGVPRNVREIYKIYKKKSATVVKNGIKREKNFEYLRSLEDKFEYQ